MGTLIPAFGSCSARMTSGENRFSRRLESKLDDDYLCWYDVSIGEKTRHPDFVVLHPSRGLLILEVKDWRLSTIQSMDKQHVALLTERGIVHQLNPLEQARQYMFAITTKLERDPKLVFPVGSLKGKPFFPYGHGVVLSYITRRQFDANNMGDVIPPHLVICQDEMLEDVDPEAFQKRLWDMFPYKFTMNLSSVQIDRIRWHMFPEVRIQTQADLFATEEEAIQIPDLLRVMDLQQEQLARSLGDGHRVIHGVAGSGKTMILGYRAEYLAKTSQHPVLVLCYNKSLAGKLASIMDAKGLQDNVHVVNFHAWCVRQLKAFQIEQPAKTGTLDTFFDACVEKMIEAVDQGLIPKAQYSAILIDEGHDFKPEWFKLVVKMLNPESNSLLVMYDDAQSIYRSRKKPRYSFSSVGIQAQGRTTILKLNYRNTAQILAVARAFAGDLLTETQLDDDQAPVVPPMSAGRHGAKPSLTKLPHLKAEADAIAQRLRDANKTGTPWRDMAVLYRRNEIGRTLTEALRMKDIPCQWQGDRRAGVDHLHDSVKLITMHSSKGLEFPLVCIPSFGASPAKGEEETDEGQLLYVAMTRATHELVMTYSETGKLVETLQAALQASDQI